jgi:hypothetical protein
MKNFGARGLWISMMIILSLFLFFCCLNYLKKFFSPVVAEKFIVDASNVKDIFEIK